MSLQGGPRRSRVADSKRAIILAIAETEGPKSPSEVQKEKGTKTRTLQERARVEEVENILRQDPDRVDNRLVFAPTENVLGQAQKDYFLQFNQRFGRRVEPIPIRPGEGPIIHMPESEWVGS